MPKYNHAFDLAFELISDDEQGEDVTASMIIIALQARLVQMVKEDNVLECVGCPFDTYEIN